MEPRVTFRKCLRCLIAVEKRGCEVVFGERWLRQAVLTAVARQRYVLIYLCVILGGVMVAFRANPSGPLFV